jgi:hypothetical protein
VKPTLTAGELVDITIRGARVEAFNAGYTTFAPKGGAHITIETGSVGVDITRVAPIEWPPQPGDVWDDAHGGSWWARPDSEEDLTLQSEKGGSDYPDWVLQSYGPMRLAFRRGWSPAPAPTADEPGQVDERAEAIAGLRALADWLEANPDLPINTTSATMQVFPRGQTYGDEAGEIAALRTIGALIGAELKQNGPHVDVVRAFAGGIRYEAVVCNVQLADHALETAVSVPDITLADGASHAGSRSSGDASAADPVSATSGDGAAVAHYHAGGAAGGPGENEAECACGVTFAGFDTHAKAVAELDRHIADAGKLPRLIQPAPITDPALEG